MVFIKATMWNYRDHRFQETHIRASTIERVDAPNEGAIAECPETGAIVLLSTETGAMLVRERPEAILERIARVEGRDL